MSIMYQNLAAYTMRLYHNDLSIFRYAHTHTRTNRPLYRILKINYHLSLPPTTLYSTTFTSLPSLQPTHHFLISKA